jgi:hypothetical protein
VIATRIISNTKTKSTGEIQTTNLLISERIRYEELTTTPG